MLPYHFCWVIACTVILVAGCHSASSVNTVHDSQAANELLSQAQREIAEDQALLIDVREPDEWERGHLADATLVPMSQLQDEVERTEVLQQLPKGQRIYTHCSKGIRARKCAEMLRQLGYDAVPLAVSFDKLIATGFLGTP